MFINWINLNYQNHLEINDKFLLWISFPLLISFLSWTLQSSRNAGGIWFLTQISLGSMRVVPSQYCCNLSCTYVGTLVCSRLTDQIYACLPSRENKINSNQEIQHVFLDIPVRLWMCYGALSGIYCVGMEEKWLLSESVWLGTPRLSKLKRTRLK